VADIREHARVATVSRRRGVCADAKSLGTVHDQRFYAVRYLPASQAEEGRFDLPIPRRAFNALIYAAVPLAEARLRDLALTLLRHGLRQAVCCGPEAEAMGEMIDAMADDHEITHDGRSVLASIHDDESLDEVIDYFILPNGIAETSLLVVLGDEVAMRDTLRSFARVTGDMRERLAATAR